MREDPDKLIRRERALIVAVEEEGVGEAEAGGAAGEEEAEVGMPVTGLQRTRTKLRGAITTGSGVMTRRWQGEARHPRRRW